ncbi:glutamate 5-kinase [Desulforamulus hydrothermalis]|uniref:Glutamate 5-kinase n=1 Tax=Desulforamulus hydrothermalis Lam5 = DSM 18033 TaxID=1121428 RepID=K8EBJ9_9FIRM|nr:glutamate 5-kinase [Desulforamulus hydrothermalis]CCO09038.1 Glutamate 5-kinase [Desulforamulus hydrothermalis Lam5 = DSM 18033]SHG77567.1 glutamate 5-kinase [Desulforamulus hydrothermalis Lam5 = DSM 18033]
MDHCQRIVIKIGSSSLTDSKGLLDDSRMAALADAITELLRRGWQPVLVSSGAVAAGLGQLGWHRSNLTMPERQAAAAVGQGLLMEKYNDLFQARGIQVGQVLLTKEDLAHRRRYLNARNTFNVLLNRQVLPIVNENDTVAFAEIRFGDNDTLSALVAGLVEAALLVILTDIDGLYSGDPRKDPQARLIPVVRQVDENIMQAAGGSGSPVGTGGMRTKLAAARIAARSGVRTVVTCGKDPSVILAVAAGERPGTCFEPSPRCLRSRKQWIAFGSVARGTLTIDRGAVKALTEDNKSLLAVGVTAVKGTFPAGSVVAVEDDRGIELARGISNLSSDDLKLVIKNPQRGLEVIHRDWLVCERSFSLCQS